MLHGALLAVYPIIKQDNTIKIWERTGYENATSEEKEKYEHLKKESQEIKQKINQKDKKLTEIENSIKKRSI